MVPCIKEQALIGWQDQDGLPRVLGSLSPFNKSEAGLLLLVDLDGALGVFIRLSLRVSIRVRGRARPRHLLLVFPLESLAHPSFTFDTLKISQADAASAIHEAGLSPEGRVLRTHFVLTNPGYAVLPNTNAESIVPENSTATSILAAVRSLSTATQFEVYMKPSDYARVGLNRLAQHLKNDALKPLALSDVFDDDVKPLDWSCVGLFATPRHKQSSRRKESSRGKDSPHPPPAPSQRQASPPPPYAPSHPVASQPAVPQPLLAFSRIPVPPGMPPTPSPPSSPSVFARRSSTPPGVLPAPTGVVNTSSAVIQMPEPQPQPQSAPHTLQLQAQDQRTPDAHPGVTSRIRASLVGADAAQVRAHLESIISVWLAKAFTCNPLVYNHPQLRPTLHAMARHAREANVSAFCTARIECAARFFLDPMGATSEFVLALACGFRMDREELLTWMLGEDGDPFADVLAWPQLLELGEVARDAAVGGVQMNKYSAPTGDPRLLKRYNRCKSACVGRVLSCCEK